MSDDQQHEREQRVRAALHGAAEPGSRGIDVGAVLEGSRRRRRPRAALAGGALALALVASGAGLFGGLLPQAGLISTSDTAEESASTTFENESAPAQGEDGAQGSDPDQGPDATRDADDAPQAIAGEDACAIPDAALAEERGLTIGTPAVLGRDGLTEVAITGLDGSPGTEVLVESIALLEGGRVAAVLLGADGARPVAAEPGEAVPIAVQGALIGCGDGPPASGAYEAVATVRIVEPSGAVRTLRSSAMPISLR